MQAKLDWLREQIEMRTVGLAWLDRKTPWSSSSDGEVGTVGQLKDYLLELLQEEQDLEELGGLPCKVRALQSKSHLAAECPPPQLRRKTFKALGTPTAQAASISDDRTELSMEELVNAAERR